MIHFCDTESDSFKFESKRVWILCALSELGFTISLDYREMKRLGEETVQKWTEGCKLFATHTEHLNYLKEHTVCFHNYFQHDKPLLRKFVKDWLPAGEEDTYILSQLFNPDRGFHGLEKWGEFLGIPKPEYTEWGAGLTEEMIHRCKEDVRITQAVFNHLEKERKSWDWERAIEIEYKIADIQGRQELHGVYFDMPKAIELAEWLYTQIHALDKELVEGIPLVVEKGIEVLNPFKKDGTLLKRVEEYFYGDAPVEVDSETEE